MSNIDFKIRSRDIKTLEHVILANDPEADIDLINRAYTKAFKAHNDQKRLSGEPYIIHPLEVAIILAELKLDTTTISAALLHDVVEDTVITLDDIKNEFSIEIAQLVDGVTKISSLKNKSKHIKQVENLRKMLVATIKDVRVILIKLADKLHNMRTIMFQPEEKQNQVASEVLDIYAPLAGRLGISKIRSELEDLAFHILYHTEYHKITDSLAKHKNEIDEYIDNIRNILQEKLQQLNIEAKITGRGKHYYSIYKKMRRQQKSLDEIFDIIAVRIITEKVKDCYGVLGVVHSTWTPIASRFKDHIAVPKTNMYQSLHTTVMGPDGHPLEVQIRTFEMHATAEMGIAAHWLYKEDSHNIRKEYKNIELIKNMNKWHLDVKDTREFMKELKMDLEQYDEIFVFTPRGKIIKLAKGSTPVDFAYAIHTEIGNKCVGAKVNSKMASLRNELKSGDIIEILTSKKGHPSEEWIKFVKSSNARYKIRNWLRKNKSGMTYSDKEKQDKKKEITEDVTLTEPDIIKIKKYTRLNKSSISVNGSTNIMIKLSQCCQPIPGDKVIGFITRGRGITVHKQNCQSLKRLQAERERFINIVWEASGSTYPVKIAVYALDRQNLFKDLAEEIAISKTNIIKLQADTIEKGNAVFKIVMEVRDIAHYNEVISRIRKIRGVTHVYKLKEKFSK